MRLKRLLSPAWPQPPSITFLSLLQHQPILLTVPPIPLISSFCRPISLHPSASFAIHPQHIFFSREPRLYNPILLKSFPLSCHLLHDALLRLHQVIYLDNIGIFHFDLLYIPINHMTQLFILLLQFCQSLYFVNAGLKSIDGDACAEQATGSVVIGFGAQNVGGCWLMVLALHFIYVLVCRF